MRLECAPYHGLAMGWVEEGLICFWRNVSFLIFYLLILFVALSYVGCTSLFGLFWPLFNSVLSAFSSETKVSMCVCVCPSARAAEMFSGLFVRRRAARNELQENVSRAPDIPVWLCRALRNANCSSLRRHHGVVAQGKGVV